jgi:hypothetical protein
MQNLKKKYETLEEKFPVIFDKIDKGHYCIVHMKNTMEPMIFDHNQEKLYNPPDGYMKYDNDNFRKHVV